MSRRRSNTPEKVPSSLRERRKSEDSDELEDDGMIKPPKVKHHQREENGGVNWVWVGVVVALLAVIVFFLMKTEPAIDNERIHSELKHVLRSIKSNFPTQEDDLWSRLLFVLATVSSNDNSCPKVILLLDQGDGRTQRASQCLVKMVANKSASIVPSEERQALYLTGDDLNCSGCVEVQRENVKRHGIVVIQHLENFPILSAEALHFFCDEHETAFAKAAYLLTMTVSKVEKTATKTAENALRTSWKSMQQDNLDALISRLTSLVVFVQPETNLNCD